MSKKPYVESGLEKEAVEVQNFEYHSLGILNHQSSIIKYNPESTNLLYTKRVNGFTRNSVTVSDYDVYTNDSFYLPILGSTADLVTGNGELVKTVYLNGITGDNFLISVLVKLTSTNTDVPFYLEALYNGINKRKYLRKTTTNSEYELVTLGIHLEATITNIKITLGINNSTMVIGGIQLLRKDFGVNYEYDTNYNVSAVETSEGKANYTYNSNNLVSTVSYPDYTSETYTYSFINNEYKLASVIDDKGVKQEYTYDSVSGNVTFDDLSNIGNSQYISTRYLYNDDGTLYVSFDEIDNQTTYEYDDGLLKKIISPLQTWFNSVYKEFYYDNTDNSRLSRIESKYGGNSINTYYTYTNFDKVSTVTNSNSSVITYSYNSYDDYSGLALNNYSISNVEYTSSKYLPETIKYGTNSNGYGFVYDTNNNYRLTNINFVSYTGLVRNRFYYAYDYHSMLKQIYFYPYNNSSQVLLKEYYYDNDDRINRITSSYLNYTFDYTYNNDELKIVKYLINNNKKYITFDSDKNHLSTTLNTIDQNLLNLYDLVTLNDNVVSIKGLRPYTFNKFSGNPFVYDDTIGRLVFYPTYGNLVYDFDFYESGTVISRIKPVEVTNKQIIYSMYDNSNYIDLFVQSGHLYLNIFGATYSTNLTLSTSWTNVGVSYTKRVVGTSNFETYLDIRVYCGGSTYENSFLINNGFYAEYVHIGKRYSNSYRFSGYISNIAFRSAYSELSTLGTLSNELIDYVLSYKTDFLNRISKKEIISGGSKLKHEYTYRNRLYENYTSHLVESESIVCSNFNNNRTYTYDKINRLTSISDSTFGSHTYTYDSNGFVATETFGSITISYEYDNNGNIKKVTKSNYPNTPDIFTYDTVIKDRLVSYNNTQIEYSQNSPGNIVRIGNQDYTYEGKRLVEINSSSGSEHTQIKYTYDDEGLLVKRSESVWYDDDTEGYDEDTLYYYENGNLVTEIKDDVRNDYLYDNTGNLYGFIVNNSDKYFYIRDILGTIIGIVSSSGSLIRKYDYDSFGYIKNITNVVSNNIYNPMIYRGYYYDDTSYMYYLKSRFYNPEIRRFITPDNINYLDITNVGCVNLYAYCNNNPVMYSDPDGNIALSSIILLTLVGVGAIAGGTTAGVIAYNNDVRGWNLAGSILGGALVGGAVGGLIGYFAGPSVAGMLSSSGMLGSGLSFAGGLSVTGGISVNAAGTMALGGAIGLTATGSIGLTYMFSKSSRLSGKETSSDKPSWVNSEMVDMKLSAQENARILLNNKYGVGNWKSGPNTEYNKIVKWIIRCLKKYA